MRRRRQDSHHHPRSRLVPAHRTPSPTLPELTRRRAEKVLAELCDARVPPQARARVRLAVAVRGNTLTLVEERVPWNDAAGTDWTSSPVAQFRYQPTSKLWALYWPDRNTRWHLFAETPPTADIGELAHAVNLDATGIFWG